MKEGNQILMQVADNMTERGIKQCTVNAPKQDKEPLKCGGKTEELYKKLFDG